MQKAINWLAYELGFRSSQLAYMMGWSIRVAGRENLPRIGPVLLVANHQSYLDPLSVGLACRRQIAYLAKKPLLEIPILGSYLRMVNVVPIDQDGVAKEGIRNILKRLNEGWPVLVFPEGSRSETGEMLPLQPGISLLIKRVGAPIVPVGIAGTFAAWPKGQPLPMPSPIFFPPSPRTISVVMGKPRSADSVAHLPRNEMLAVLDADIRACVAEAEKLRRKRLPRSPFNGPRLA